jgi:hypothetical protein
MNIRKHTYVILGLLLASGLVSCFNDTAFDIIKMPHMLDTLIYKLEPPSGAALWAKTVVSGSDETVFNSVAAGSDGVYAAGYIQGTGTFDFGNSIYATGTAISLHNVVLVKYDFNGKALWARTVYSGSYASEFNSVAVGSDGVYAAGRINSKQTFDFGNATTPKTVAGTATSPNQNIVLVKYDFGGNTQWAISLSSGPNSSSVFSSVAVANNGVYPGVYAVGSITGTSEFDFGNSKKVTGKYSDKNIVVVNYDFDGKTLWANTVTTGPDSSEFYSVAAGIDCAYVAGYINGSVQFDFGNSKTARGLYDSGANIVLVKYDSSGFTQWAKTVASISPQINSSQFNSVAVGSDGIYAAGYISGISEYNFGGATAHGGYTIGNNTLLVKYDPTDGSAMWARAVSIGPGESVFNSVTVGSNGVYTAGYITGNSTFDFGNNVTATGAVTAGKNLIVMEYGFFGKPQWATTVNHGLASQYYSVSAGSDGIYTCGQISSTAMFDFGNNIKVTGTVASVNNVILAKYKP